MNAFEYIDEMINHVQKDHEKIRGDDPKGTHPIGYDEHCDILINMLNALKLEMEMAEYNYVIESIEGKVETFENFPVIQKNLNQDLILVQPVAIGEAELAAIDMQSLCDILKKSHDSGIIKENIIVLPPNISVFKAKLITNTKEEHTDNEE